MNSPSYGKLQLLTSFTFRFKEVTLSCLAVLMDCVTRKAVEWSLTADMRETLIFGALKMAILTLATPVKVIHQNDLGGQYVSVNYRSRLRRA